MISRQSVADGRFSVKRLGAVVEFLDHLRRPVTESDRIEGHFPYYGANGRQGSIDSYIFDEPLVLLAEDGGHFENPSRGIAYRISGKTWVNNHAHVLRPRQGIDIAYLCRVLENYDVTPFVTGTTRGKLTKSGASEIPIPLPPLPEQRRIAAILDKADALRIKRREALAQLDGLAQSIFVEMFGDPVQNPKSWPTAKLGSLVRKMGSGATPTGGDAAYKPSGISLIRSMNVHDGEFVRRNLAFIDEQQAQKLQNVAVEAGDVLLNITGASVARVCRAPLDVLPARVNQHVMIVRPSDELNPLFLERMLLNASMKRHLLKVGGAGATREAITKAEAEGLTVIVPPKTAQQEFARRMEEVTRLVATCKTSSSDLEVLFGSLQHRAFAGEL